MAALEQAVATLRSKAPEELPAYRQLVLEVAESVAAAAKGVSPQENSALERIRAALGAEDDETASPGSPAAEGGAY